MKADRMVAFTDAVIAIILTIMVLELPVPRGESFRSLERTLPLFGAYALSFVIVGIFWTNHHHLLQATRKIDGRAMWVNLSLLFWLSLFPWVIRWIGEEGITFYPVQAYGVVLTMASLTYLVLERTLIASDRESPLERAVRGHKKELLTLALNLVSLVVAFFSPWAAVACFGVVAILWLIPDRRIEEGKDGEPIVES